MCRNIRNKFLSWTYLYVHNSQNVRHMCDSDKSVQVWQEVILKIIFVQVTFETRKRNTGFFYFEAGSSKERENLNTKSLSLKDSSICSIGTYLRAGPCWRKEWKKEIGFEPPVDHDSCIMVKHIWSDHTKRRKQCKKKNCDLDIYSWFRQEYLFLYYKLAVKNDTNVMSCACACVCVWGCVCVWHCDPHIVKKEDQFQELSLSEESWVVV